MASLFLVPWTPFQDHSSHETKDSDDRKPETDAKKPLLYNVHTIVTSMEDFQRSIGGINLERLYPYQRYKVRVAAKNTLGVGQFSTDIMVINT